MKALLLSLERLIRAGLAGAVPAVHEDGEVREGREYGGADADGEDRAGRGVAVGRKVHADDCADAEDVHGGDGLGDDAVLLEHHAEREHDGDEQDGEGSARDALHGAVAALARAAHEAALDDGEGGGGVEDLVDGPAREADGDQGEVHGQELGAVGELVVEQTLGQRVVPDGVVAEQGAAVLGEREPDPAVERRREREGHDAEHAVDLGLPGLADLGLLRAVGGALAAEVDEHDGRGPVELGEALVPEVHSVVREREEEAVHGDGAARGVAVHERGDAPAVAALRAALVAELDGRRERLQHLATEAHEQQKGDYDGGERLVELQLHACERAAFNKRAGAHVVSCRADAK